MSKYLSVQYRNMVKSAKDITPGLYEVERPLATPFLGLHFLDGLIRHSFIADISEKPSKSSTKLDNGKYLTSFGGAGVPGSPLFFYSSDTNNEYGAISKGSDIAFLNKCITEDYPLVRLNLLSGESREKEKILRRLRKLSKKNNDKALSIYAYLPFSNVSGNCHTMTSALLSKLGIPYDKRVGGWGGSNVSSFDKNNKKIFK